MHDVGFPEENYSQGQEHYDENGPEVEDKLVQGEKGVAFVHYLRKEDDKDDPLQENCIGAAEDSHPKHQRSRDQVLALDRLRDQLVEQLLFIASVEDKDAKE
eukprot:CAMPEP_0170546366 /NCGR_PEP_ID=MMETSP0211-20121228/4726_1 /TAXON_ID=311385 /ORGANISM="Pseudokeronopsis sp., Strain OXSARD2" /LENGTH=101 /DNA_ID=CAMNT_0010850797 /DNA_START=571 /DNA_END=876 /DNA_ORIENTATION=+